MDNKTFSSLPMLLFSIKCYAFISYFILDFDPYIKISVLISHYVRGPKKEENKNFLSFIWFSLLQPSTFPYIKNIWKKPKHCIYIYTMVKVPCSLVQQDIWL